jgi:hypothetical protein
MEACGVHTTLDVVKATMVGAQVTQMVSALLRHGPSHLHTIRAELQAWLEENEWSSLDEMRGNMSLQRVPDPVAYEREDFRMMLRSPACRFVTVKLFMRSTSCVCFAEGSTNDGPESSAIPSVAADLLRITVVDFPLCGQFLRNCSGNLG